MNNIEQKIIELWTLGHTTARIASIIGISKNSVCGRIFRMRERGVTIPPKRSTKEIIVPKKQAERMRAPQVKRVAMTGQHLASKPVKKTSPEVAKYTRGSAKDSLNIKFWKLKPESCRYVVNDGRPENFIFCGAPKERGPYCAEHAAICYNVPSYEQRREMKRTAARFG